jgi:hypothetical protein
MPTDQQLAEAVLAILAEWYASIGQELPEGYTADLTRQALALVSGADQVEGGDAGGAAHHVEAEDPSACKVRYTRPDRGEGQGRGRAPYHRGVRRPAAFVPPSPFRHRKGLPPYRTKDSWFARCPRDKFGRCLPKGQGDQGGASAPAGAEGDGDGQAAAPKARARTKVVRRLERFTSPAIRRRILHGLRNEGQLADAVGGLNLPDSEPADVVVLVTPGGEMVTNRDTVLSHLRQREDALKRLARAPGSPQADQLREWLKGHRLTFIEVKTLLVQQAGVVRMSAGAVARKRRWERRYGARFSTVIMDDRRGRKHSGSRLHFFAGLGNVRLTDATPVADFAGIADRIMGGGD